MKKEDSRISILSPSFVLDSQVCLSETVASCANVFRHNSKWQNCEAAAAVVRVNIMGQSAHVRALRVHVQRSDSRPSLSA